MSEQVNELAAALVKAQAAMKNPPKKRTAFIKSQKGSSYKYNYADLADIIDAIRDPLCTAGLAYVQVVKQSAGGGQSLITQLLHTSGQWMASSYPLPRQAGAQEMGSFITYARRYSLCAILGIAGEDDNDGQSATEGGPTEETTRTQLVEQMGAAAIGNRAVLEYCKREGLHAEGNTVEDLPIAVVNVLLEKWDAAVAAMKAMPAKKLPSQKKAPPAAPTPPETTIPPQESPDELPGLPSLPSPLGKLLAEAKITADDLHAYYVAAGHFPKEMTTDKLPSDYVKALTAPDNWKKVVQKIKTKKAE
ncbi:MAG: hypothetical protein A2X46_16375 [Lentisphaerae bacterium GWF2_57_35]|nr:MAG: hypothetical protein A2X46_16375 [Lentisphaerae bacterium GWF2_57_35]